LIRRKIAGCSKTEKQPQLNFSPKHLAHTRFDAAIVVVWAIAA
jgi:hypothetical protein